MTVGDAGGLLVGTSKAFLGPGGMGFIVISCDFSGWVMMVMDG